MEEIKSETAPTCASTSDYVTFTRTKGRYNIAKQYRLKNSLLAGVGFLELANAGDFAANVWNEIPVPVFAAVLMAIGGTVALSISIFAFRDARLSWKNIRILREERAYLQRKKADHAQNTQIARGADCQLHVDFRELGTELVDRIGMDVVMGFGAVLVGVGTFMAIGGADPNVYLASNLLSGYIGNTPPALYGLCNTAWSAYVWRRAHRHAVAGEKELSVDDDTIKRSLRRRVRTVQTHAAINGVTGIVAGAASLITSTMWYGYPVLVVCIMSSILCNYFWRNGIGYDRPLVRQTPSVDRNSLIEELKSVTSIRQILNESPKESLLQLVSDPQSLASILEFLVKNDLFEDFCVRLLQDTTLSTSLFGALDEELTVDVQTILKADNSDVSRYLEIAQTTINEMGSIRFKYRERYLLEALGCYLCLPAVVPEVEARTEKC